MDIRRFLNQCFLGAIFFNLEESQKVKHEFSVEILSFLAKGRQFFEKKYLAENFVTF
jgi:hypothetical protein